MIDIYMLWENAVHAQWRAQRYNKLEIDLT